MHALRVLILSGFLSHGQISPIYDDDKDEDEQGFSERSQWLWQRNGHAGFQTSRANRSKRPAARREAAAAWPPSRANQGPHDRAREFDFGLDSQIGQTPRSSAESPRQTSVFQTRQIDPAGTEPAPAPRRRRSAPRRRRSAPRSSTACPDLSGL